MPAVRPRILLGQANPDAADDPELLVRKIARYHDAVTRAGGEPRGIDARAGAQERDDAFAWMQGLLLTGGADVDPALYGQAPERARGIERDRDDLELAAFRIAQERRVPVLGVCRGLQAINVFCGGTLVQHLDGHQGPEYGQGPPPLHPLSIVPATRLDAILRAPGRQLIVNSYHHQGVTPDGLAPGLVAAAHATHPGCVLIEGLEAADPERFVVGIQCHPERTETTPAEFERLFAAFVEAARR